MELGIQQLKNTHFFQTCETVTKSDRERVLTYIKKYQLDLIL